MQTVGGGSPAQDAARKRKGCTIVAVAFGVMVLLCGFSTWGFVRMYSQPARSSPLTPSESSALLRYEDLERPFGLKPKGGSTSAKKEVYFDSSFTVSYFHDSDEAYILHDVSFEPDRSDAFLNYTLSQGTFHLRFEDMELEERHDHFTWGERRRFWLLKSEGKTIGFALIALQGRYVVEMIVTGMAFDRAAVNTFVIPKIRKTETAFKRKG